MQENHHNIPLSLLGEHNQDNIIRLDSEEHKKLHKTQNIPFHLLRTFRKKVNHILVPNDYVLDFKEDLWLHYFDWAVVRKEEQNESLNNQIKRYCTINKEQYYFNEDLLESVCTLIDQQRVLIYNILKNDKITN